jgi:dTDP-4-dehydrorhamnose reductase
MNILVTGSNGQLGSELQSQSDKFPHFQFYFVDVDQLDITSETDVFRFFDENEINICINCAAYTAVDKAETDHELALNVNAIGPENLAKACNRRSARLIHISTDFVFDGKSDTPYKTDAAKSPINVYGETKAEGESRVLLIAQNIVLIRTSWVYSSFGSNFIKTMIRLGQEKDSLNVVSDQIGQPTYAKDLAEAILTLVAEGTDLPNGIIHYSNEGAISWFEFAATIMELYGLDCQVNPIPTSDYPTPATRPHYSVLDLSETRKLSYIKINDWKDSLKECIKLLKQQ